MSDQQGVEGPTTGERADDGELPGHAGHVHRAESTGLPGELGRRFQVTMMGAGSMFTPEVVNDILRIPGPHPGGVIWLVDVDEARLEPMERLAQKALDHLDRPQWEIRATTDRTEALPGTDYVVNCIEVSGLACVRHDNDIPARYGVDQCIGDTIGPGGLFKGLRTIPVWLEILADVERLCPDAWVLNYTNPMSMMCLAAARTSPVTVVGLCHSVQGTSQLLARRAGVDHADLVWQCAGVNHLAWFTTLEAHGRDLYPELMERARRDLAGDPVDPEDAGDLVRKDMMLHFGAFITESSGHLSEYLPYYRSRPEALKRWAGDGYDGQSSFYADEWPGWRKAYDELREALLAEGADLEFPRSWEYASWIIEAREKDHPFRFHATVPNSVGAGGQLVSNLPADGVVEVACYVDRAGIRPTRFGRLPAQMASICASNMAMYDLGAQAAVERSRQLARWSLMLDPLTSACCTPEEIAAMTDELFEAEAEFLPGFT